MATENCRVTVKRINCGAELTGDKPVYAPFDVCLPFGRVLRYDGTGFTLEGGVNTPDGVYGLFTVENGCITGAQEQPVCDYTPQPCTPAAAPCGDSGSGSVTLQPGTDNLLNFDSSGRLGAQLNYEAGDGITVTGYGTASSPLRISVDAAESESVALRSANSAIKVSGSGVATDPFYLEHVESAAGAGTYNGITIDDYGHVTGIEEVTGALTDVMAGPGLGVTASGTIRTISLNSQSDVSGTYVVGGYSVTYDTHGIVTGISEVVRLTDEATLDVDPAQYIFTLTQGGSVAGLTRKAAAAEDNFAEIFTPARSDTTLTFTTAKSGYFKIQYQGLLPLTNATAVNGFVALASPYRLLVNGRTITAYARRIAAGYTEVVALTDALYAAGEHTVAISNATTDFSFSDTGFLSVTLVQRP